MTPAELMHLRTLVVGCGVTGASVVRYLHAAGVAFEVVDDAGRAGDVAGDVIVAHDRLDAALASAFDVIVLSPGVPRAHPAIRAALDAGASVIGDIELFASAVDAPVVAVTGSNGKSTVVAWLAHALVATGIDAVACGNIGDSALDALARGGAAIYVLSSPATSSNPPGVSRRWRAWC